MPASGPMRQKRRSARKKPRNAPQAFVRSIFISEPHFPCVGAAARLDSPGALGKQWVRAVCLRALSMPELSVHSEGDTPHRANSSQSGFYTWGALISLVFASVLIILGLFWRTTTSIVHTWNTSSTFSHGFLVVPICFYLIWIRRHRVMSQSPGPNLYGLTLLPILGFGWLLGNLSTILLVQQLALVAMLVGFIWTVLGTALARILRFPLLFLFFAVPMGETLIPPLQDLTAFFAVKGIELSGIPIVMEGRFLYLPSGVWEVAVACSGIRYLLASVMLGSLFASLVYRSWGRRLVFLLASLVVPLLANGIRAYGILMLAHATNNRVAVGVDHLIYGWLFFSFVIFLLFWAGWRWQEMDGQASSVGVSSSQSGPTRAVASTGPTGSIGKLALTAAGGVVVLALAPLSARVLLEGSPSEAKVRAGVPAVSAPWAPVEEGAREWAPRFQGSDAEVKQGYAKGAQDVHLYVAYYRRQRPGAELVNYANVIEGGNQWVQTGQTDRQAVVDGRPLTVRETTLSSRFGTRQVWSWYWVGGEFTANRYRAKLLQVKGPLLGGSRAAALIAIAADHDGYHADTAAETLQEFLQHASLAVWLEGLSD